MTHTHRSIISASPSSSSRFVTESNVSAQPNDSENRQQGIPPGGMIYNCIRAISFRSYVCRTFPRPATDPIFGRCDCECWYVCIYLYVANQNNLYVGRDKLNPHHQTHWRYTLIARGLPIEDMKNKSFLLFDHRATTTCQLKRLEFHC